MCRKRQRLRTTDDDYNLLLILSTCHLLDIRFKSSRQQMQRTLTVYKNKCVFLKDREILEDKTYGFTKSGNIKLKIPDYY